MGWTVLSAGRWKSGPLKAAFEDYAHRLRPPLALKEIEPKGRLTGQTLREAEAALLLEAVPKGAVLVALDGGGKNLDSEALAARLGTWRDQGRAEIAFLIGGADGLLPDLCARADLTLSLGAMTWPHLLARVMLAEQLYRAQQILAGHPYHRAERP
jgi:23S rRNA (pseudouridine1915-N3)-methyltransferase